MDKDLKDRILKNKFIDRLRDENVIDRVEFDALGKALEELAKEWKDASLIDKKVMQDLYVLHRMTLYMAEVNAPHAPERAQEIEEMAIKIDALVLDCLNS